MKNVLSLTAEEARDFFLKAESYCNFDLPPYFNFHRLLDSVAKHLGERDLKEFFSSDSLLTHSLEGVNYKLVSNKDGQYSWRLLQLIHPVLYVYLVRLITGEENWDIIKDRFSKLIAESSGIQYESLPIISENKKDKVDQVTNWYLEIEQKSIIYSLNFDYLFHTDIVDCYGSIYTHAIAWALHGKDCAKGNKRDEKLLGNKIDKCIQAMQQGQTNGIPQGSVLMDFLAEILLCYIDSLLAEKIGKDYCYKIIRYRDDYRIFTNNPQVAEQIIKDLADVLNDGLGMRINSAKTEKCSNVIRASIKPDKLACMIAGKKVYRNLQEEAHAILVFSESFPNSGQVQKYLEKFYHNIEKRKKEYKNSISREVLLSIVTDIAYKNPRTYPIIVAIISKLISGLKENKKKEVIQKISEKIKRVPNNGILEIWLQRITIKLEDKNIYEYSEVLCKKVQNESTTIWNSDWLNFETKEMIDSFSIIDESTLEKMGVIIESN